MFGGEAVRPQARVHGLGHAQGERRQVQAAPAREHEVIRAVAPDEWVINFTNPAGMVTEAMRAVLGDRVVGICDTNSDPGLIDYPIPGNDDAIRSIKLFSDLVAEADLPTKRLLVLPAG